MNIKNLKTNFKKLVAITTLICMNTTMSYANLNTVFAEEEIEEVSNEDAPPKLKDVTYTVDSITVETKDESKTTTTVEGSGTYESREEAEEAVRDAVSKLEEEGYTDIDHSITEVPVGSHTEEGTIIEEEEKYLDSKEEAETELEDRIEGLEEEGYRIDSSSVFEMDNEYQDGLDHKTSTETTKPDEKKYTTEQSARDSAESRVDEIIDGLSDNQELSYNIEVTHETIKDGEEVASTETRNMSFTYDKETKTYVNKDGIALEDYIESTKSELEGLECVNIKVSNKTYSDGSHTEVGDSVHVKSENYDTVSEAQAEYERLAGIYTIGNGYTNIIFSKYTEQVKTGEHTETDTKEGSNLTESEKDSFITESKKTLEEAGYTVTDQDVEAIPFNVIVKEDGEIVYEEKTSTKDNIEGTTEYSTKEEAQRVIDGSTTHTEETKEQTDGTVKKYTIDYSFKLVEHSKTEECTDSGLTETYDSVEEAMAFVKELEDKGFKVKYSYDEGTKETEVTIDETFDTEEKALERKEELEALLHDMTKPLEIEEKETTDEELMDSEHKVETITGFSTYKEAEEKLDELLGGEYSDTHDENYYGRVVTGEAIEIEIDRKESTKKFSTIDEAKAYILKLQEDGYDISKLSIKVDETVIENWKEQERVKQEEGQSTSTEKVYYYNHLDIVTDSGAGTSITYIDTIKNTTTTISGSLTVSSVIVDNDGVTRALSMTDKSKDDARNEIEYKSERLYSTTDTSDNNKKTTSDANKLLPYEETTSTKKKTDDSNISDYIKMDDYSAEQTYHKGEGRYYVVLNENSNSYINDNTIVTVKGTLSYTLNGESKTLDYTVTGRLGDGENRCINCAGWGFDLVFETITIVNENVLIDTNIDYEYQVLGEAILTGLADTYDVEVYETDRTYEYKLVGKGHKTEKTGAVTLNASASKDITVYTIDTTKISKEFVSKMETKYDVKVTGSKIVEEFKTVYGVELDCNVLNTIIDKNQYLNVELTGNIMEDILTEYFGYIINLDVTTPIMKHYYGYRFTATEMLEVIDYYYNVVIKAQKVEIEEKENSSIPKTGENNRLTFDLTLIGTSLLLGSTLVLKKKKEEEEKGKTLSK